jgi:hypothetical protein
MSRPDQFRSSTSIPEVGTAALKDRKHKIRGQNSAYDWGGFGAVDYNKRNYKDLSREDRAVANGIIDRIGMLPTSYFGSRMNLREIGTGGTLRTAALAAPLLHPEASVTLTDVAEPQLLATQEVVDKIRLSGDLDVWGVHEQAMAARDLRWKGAVRFIGEHALVVPQSLWELPPESVQVATEGHVLESSTGDQDEYLEGVRRFYESLTPGGIAIRLFMIGSTGYKAGREFPAISITPEDVEHEATSMGMQVVGGAFGVPASSHGARDADDPTSYDGFGGAVLLKPQTK